MALRVVLLADLALRACLESLLQASGELFQIQRAEELSHLHDQDADIVLAELGIPQLPIFTSLSTLREVAQRIPVVIVSRVNDPSIARQAIRDGIQDYLPLEQVDHRQLARALLYAVDRHQRWQMLLTGVPTLATRTDPFVPTWDDGRRELRVGTLVVKRFHKPSPNQELILSAFEEQNWQHRILDPIPYHRDICPAERLRATIRSLNQRHERPVLRFYGDGSGQAIIWDFVDDKKHAPSPDPPHFQLTPPPR